MRSGFQTGIAHRSSGLPVIAAVMSVGWLAGCGASSQADEAWFGLPRPPGLGDPHQPMVSLADVELRGAIVPAGEEVNQELEGVRILELLDAITGFSRRDRAAGNALWGRVTGRRA